MTHFFEGETADHAWRQAAVQLSDTRLASAQSSRDGDTRELLHAIISIRSPTQRWVTSRQPAINPAFAIAEVIWILLGRNDAAFINHWFPGLPRFAGEGENYHGAYGFRLRKAFGYDQIDRAYNALSRNPDSRQVVLQIWNPTTDSPDAQGQPVAADIPCNLCALPKVRNGKLEWLQIMRSNDLLRGLPYNLVQFTCLQEVLAGWLDVEVGTYAHVSDSLHVYERDFPSIESLEPIDPMRNNDSLACSRIECDAILSQLGNMMDRMVSMDLSCREFRKLASIGALPKAFQNLFLVVAADSARRRQWPDLADELMVECTNPGLVQTWKHWLA